MPHSPTIGCTAYTTSASLAQWPSGMHTAGVAPNAVAQSASDRQPRQDRPSQMGAVAVLQSGLSRQATHALEGTSQTGFESRQLSLVTHSTHCFALVSQAGVGIAQSLTSRQPTHI